MWSQLWLVAQLIPGLSNSTVETSQAAQLKEEYAGEFAFVTAGRPGISKKTEKCPFWGKRSNHSPPAINHYRIRMN